MNNKKRENNKIRKSWGKQTNDKRGKGKVQ